MKKKIICMFLACTITIAMTGCEKEKDDNLPESEVIINEEPTTIETQETETTNEISESVEVTDPSNQAYVLSVFDFYSENRKETTLFSMDKDGNNLGSFTMQEILDDISDEELRTAFVDGGLIKAVYGDFLIMNAFYWEQPNQIYAINIKDHSLKPISEYEEGPSYLEVYQDVLYYTADGMEYAFSYDASSDSFVSVENANASFLGNLSDETDNCYLDLSSVTGNTYSITGYLDRFGYILKMNDESAFISTTSNENEKIEMDNIWNVTPISKDYILVTTGDEEGLSLEYYIYQISTKTAEQIPSEESISILGSDAQGIFYSSNEDEKDYIGEYQIFYYNVKTKESTSLYETQPNAKLIPTQFTTVGDKSYMVVSHDNNYEWLCFSHDQETVKAELTGLVAYQPEFLTYGTLEPTPEVYHCPECDYLSFVNYTEDFQVTNSDLIQGYENMNQNIKQDMTSILENIFSDELREHDAKMHDPNAEFASTHYNQVSIEDASIVNDQYFVVTFNVQTYHVGGHVYTGKEYGIYDIATGDVADITYQDLFEEDDEE